MNIRILLISLCIGAFLLVFGGALGIVYQSQIQGKKPAVLTNTQSPLLASAVKTLSSKVIPSISAYGQVANVNGRNVTLTSEGESIVVAMNNDAKMYALSSASVTTTKPATTKPAIAAGPISQPIDLAAIKNGDNVSINMKVLPDGTIQGYYLVVLPPPPAATATTTTTTPK